MNVIFKSLMMKPIIIYLLFQEDKVLATPLIDLIFEH